ncbi:hypothetical protein [Actinomadura sp. KC216]|uniref:hypothetical protein n=1 Tax=Actinomadura sp. KC216 TaxID=2530370 RepID=UPI00140468D6|nr:hypothetical protein [Actinomadura sp. KC216]
MSEAPQDPAGTTHQFQNFANQAPAPKSGPNLALIGGIVAVVAILAIIVVAVLTMG